MNNTETIIDPLGNEVLLPLHLCDFTTLGVDMQEVYDQPSRVIEAPAMMMQVSGADDENYYFRSVGWENALLIGTKKINGRWTVHVILKNPSSKQLRDIYKNGNNVHLIEYKAF
jgi:hypothetical protein